MQAREKEKEKKRKEKKNLHKTLERAGDYSEITQMGASREARGLEWGFASHTVPEKQAHKALILFQTTEDLSLNRSKKHLR